MNILLIEDDPWLRDLYRDVLADAGHLVRAVADAQASLDALDEQSAQVIVLDLLLSGANGIGLLHELRSYPDWAAIPVVVHSAVPEAQCGLSPEDWREYGVAAYVHKLASRPQELVRAVRRAAAV